MRNRYVRRNKTKERVFRCVCSALIVFIVATLTITVKGSPKTGSGYDENYYDVLENAYLEEVSDALRRENLSKAGINLTKVTRNGQERTYKLVIYSKQFAEEERKKEVLGHLEKITFGDSACELEICLQEI